MISTKDFSLLPNKQNFQNLCKSISVLDAIICPQWAFRFYSYNCKWGEGEEFFEMRNEDDGDLMNILFLKDRCVINGFSYQYQNNKKSEVTKNLPEIYNEFIFGEPVTSNGTSFCLWTNENGNWEVGNILNYNDNSSEIFEIFDGNPQTYIDWASEYYEGYYKETGIPIEIVTQIYEGKPITKEMALSIAEEVRDWKLLEDDLKEINYPYNFS